MIVGYKRVSSVEQKFDRQDLEKIEKVFEEKVSGANTEREALADSKSNKNDDVVCCPIHTFRWTYLSNIRINFIFHSQTQI